MAEKKIVVVAAGDQPQAEAALRYAAGLMDRAAVEFHIVQIIPDHDDYAPDSLYSFTGYARHLKDARQQAQERAAATFNQLAEELQVQHCVVQREALLQLHNRRTAIGKALCGYAAEVGAALLVVVPHGKGLLHDLRGSVAAYCLHHAACPVLLTGPLPKGEEWAAAKEDARAEVKEEPAKEQEAVEAKEAPTKDADVGASEIHACAASA